MSLCLIFLHGKLAALLISTSTRPVKSCLLRGPIVPVQWHYPGSAHSECLGSGRGYRLRLKESKRVNWWDTHRPQECQTSDPFGLPQSFPVQLSLIAQYLCHMESKANSAIWWVALRLIHINGQNDFHIFTSWKTSSSHTPNKVSSHFVTVSPPLRMQRRGQKAGVLQVPSWHQYFRAVWIPSFREPVPLTEGIFRTQGRADGWAQSTRQTPSSAALDTARVMCVCVCMWMGCVCVCKWKIRADPPRSPLLGQPAVWMEQEPWVTQESVAGGKVRYWPLNCCGAWVSRAECVCTAGGTYEKHTRSREESAKVYIYLRLIKLEPLSLGKVAAKLAW